MIQSIITCMIWWAATGLLFGQISQPSLTPDRPSGQPAGTTIVWTGGAKAAGELEYRFRSGVTGGPWHLIRDWDTRNTLEWKPLDENQYTVSLSIRLKNLPSAETRIDATYQIISRLTGQQPLVTITSHPLIALYSAPPRPAGCRLSVEYRLTGTEIWRSTPEVFCQPGKSTNLYLAGLRFDSTYEVHHVIKQNGTASSGPLMTFTTGSAPATLPVFTAVTPPAASASTADWLHFISTVPAGSKPIPLAVDLEGFPVWYLNRFQEAIYIVTNPVPGGTVLYLKSDGENTQGQYLAELDLAGFTVHETNTRRINEQLLAIGFPAIGAFDHEAVRFPDGSTLVKASVENVQPAKQKTAARVVLGDAILALDADWQLKWAWNSFDHLDPDRQIDPTETCADSIPGCPPLFKGLIARDWTHGNVISYSPVDGHLIYSSRAQDWVMKIDYANGTGSGDIIWTLGLEGDFQTDSADPYPWFSHQHGAIYTGLDQLSIFDNGNTRCADGEDCPSRCQVWQLNEKNLTARAVLNVPVGYSMALGFSHKLSNGNFHFTSGAQSGESLFGEAIEITPAGEISHVLRGNCSFYRSCRLSSLYQGIRTVPVWGDLNMDGIRGTADELLLLQWLAENLPELPAGPASADLDGDGIITVKDLLRLREGYFQ